MYQQPRNVYHSSESLRRLSSNNPFRQHYEAPKQTNRSSLSVNSTGNNSNFEEWIQKNKQLLDESSDEEETFEPVNMNSNLNATKDNRNGYSPQPGSYTKPVFPPKPQRAGSDSSVNYSNKKMSSNNPFAAAMNEPGSYKHHREPPPVPQQSKSQKIPPRPPKSDALPPPSYEEAAGSEKARSEYPKEKSSSSRYHSSSRGHRSHSDGTRPHRSHRSDKERKSHKSKSPSKKPEPVKAKNLDTIDKLDVTAFFGGGFHHDGPFDACTPHRNKNVKAAPVMAFPVNGPNSTMKDNIVKKDEQMNLAFGNYIDQNEIIGRKPTVKRSPASDNQVPLSAGRADPSLYISKQNPSLMNFSANMKAEPIHGSTTAGLGSSTFIDGAPAPKIAGDDHLNTSNGGLGRKKSIVSRLRKNSSEGSSRRTSSDADPNLGRKGSIGNGAFNDTEDDGFGAGSSLLRRVKSLKVRR